LGKRCKLSNIRLGKRCKLSNIRLGKRCKIRLGKRCKMVVLLLDVEKIPGFYLWVSLFDGWVAIQWMSLFELYLWLSSVIFAYLWFKPILRPSFVILIHYYKTSSIISIYLLILLLLLLLSIITKWGLILLLLKL
jgi:hypothetical protein